MKFISSIAIALTLMVGINPTHAKHQDHKAAAGPKGGTVVEIEPLQAEFFVNAERKVEVTFYDKKMKLVPPGGQVVNVVAETTLAKTKLALAKKGDSFISNSALPEGDGYTVVLQIKTAPDAKVKNFRILYQVEICEKCKRAEYACTCETHGNEGHKH